MLEKSESSLDSSAAPSYLCAMPRVRRPPTAQPTSYREWIAAAAAILRDKHGIKATAVRTRTSTRMYVRGLSCEQAAAIEVVKRHSRRRAAAAPSARPMITVAARQGPGRVVRLSEDYGISAGCHSAFRPSDLTSADHFVSSRSISAAYSSGVEESDSAPTVAKRARMSPLARTERS
jgi:hypothetical protein